MRKIGAIFWLTLKSAVRSRLFAGSALLLFACMAGLPFLVKGDGTAVGEARVLIYYNIGIAGMLVGVLALLQACGAVSQEISERQIQLVRAKPVSTMHIWLGKWLGVLCVNAVLIAVAGTTTRAAIWARGLAGDDVKAEVLTARRRIAPAEERVEYEVDHLYLEMKEAGRILPESDESAIRQQLKLAIVSARTTIGPGQQRRWRMEIPTGTAPKGSGGTELRSLFNAAYRDEKPMLCSWRILSDEGDELYSVAPAAYMDGLNRLPLPEELVTEHSSLVVEFTNEETRDGRTVIFNERRGLEILVNEGGFGANMFRALLVVFIITGLVAALGLTMGAVLSFPVAVFASVGLVIASLIAHFFMATEVIPHSHDGCDHASHEEFQLEIGEKMAAGFERIIGPVFSQKPAELLSEGLLIAWEDVAGTALLLFVVYPLLLFMGGALGLGRRQLALPESF